MRTTSSILATRMPAVCGPSIIVRRASSRAARLLSSLAVLLALALACLPVRALGADLGEPAIAEARAAIVCDETGAVLWSRDAEDELEPASITKVMTAMVALDAGIPLDTVCTIHDVDLGDDSQTAGYKAGDAPTLEELMLAMLVYSGNDAATNVALNVCDTLDQFVARMNEKAALLGMGHTHFVNVHGLEADGHYSCAADLATMGRHAMRNYPFIARAVATRSVDVRVGGNEVTLASTDELMDAYPGLLGIKTGAVHTGTAFLGACRREGVTLYSCVLGCKTGWGRFSDTAAIFDWAYASYRRRTLARGGWVLRVCTFADNFALKCLVRVPADGITGVVWPAGEGIAYRNVMCGRGVLVLPGQAYGGAWWRQGARLVAGACWQVDDGLYQLPGWSEFTLPLFVEEWPPPALQSLGEGAAA